MGRTLEERKRKDQSERSGKTCENKFKKLDLPQDQQQSPGSEEDVHHDIHHETHPPTRSAEQNCGPTWSTRIVTCPKCQKTNDMTMKHARLDKWPWFRRWHCKACKAQDLSNKWLCICGKIVTKCEVHGVDPRVHVTTKRWATTRTTATTATSSTEVKPPAARDKTFAAKRAEYRIVPVVHTVHPGLVGEKREVYFDPQRFPKLAAKFNKMHGGEGQEDCKYTLGSEMSVAAVSYFFLVVLVLCRMIL